MAEELKPITLYSHATGPNPWKVAILLEELKLPYTTIFKEFSELKQEPYISINPNGRVPGIEDPNTGIVLAEVSSILPSNFTRSSSPPPRQNEGRKKKRPELSLSLSLQPQLTQPRAPPKKSGAIIQYLIETYDKSHNLTYTTFPEKFQLNQWLHFQTSGQGPYFGQKAWFSNYHAEKLPSAEARYEAEIKRVLGVIEAHLQKTGGQYLVGDKCTYADLAWVTWDSLLGWLVPGLDAEKEFPGFAAWNARVCERPAVKKVLEAKAKKMSG